jgi:hypothetical protein
MYNKDREINRLNTLNVRSATKSVRNSLILDDLEAISVADFLRQLSLDDEGRRRTEEEDIRKRNADVLDAIGKAISATKARAEEKRRKEQEERLRIQKLEQERRRVFYCFIVVSLTGIARARATREGTVKARTCSGLRKGSKRRRRKGSKRSQRKGCSCQKAGRRAGAAS